MTVPITSPTPTPVIGSLEYRKPAYAPVDTNTPIVEALARDAAGAFERREGSTDNGFDSILCATLKALKGENPSVFTSLLQSCTSLTDSSSAQHRKTLKERNFIDGTKKLDADADAEFDGSSDALMARINNDLPEKRQD